jgi:hypothetical protein
LRAPIEAALMPKRHKKRLHLVKRFPYVAFSGLGSTPAEHSAQASTWVSGTREAARDTVRFAAKGQCPAAFSALVRMNRKWGSALTAYQGAGWKRKFPGKVDQQVEGAEKVFARNCIAPRASHPSGPPRLTLVNGARRRKRR